MVSNGWRIVALAATASAFSGISACQTIQQMTALQNVQFALDGVREVRLAGVRLDNVRSATDLGISGTTRILAAYASGELPLELTADVRAENPADNAVSARLAELDWTLLLEGRETVSGTIADAISLPPGEPTMVPVRAGLDLLTFFEGSGQDLLELVLALSGEQGGESKEIALRIQPTIETPLGPMRYPRPITILQERVGDR